MKRNGNFIDETGSRYGMLAVVSEAPERDGDRRVAWVCQCDCGNVKIISGHSLRSKNTQSCGCRRYKTIIEKCTTHGMAKTVEYNAWLGAIGRCFNTNNPKYPNWGGRGIVMCPRWRNSFADFIADVGIKPEPKHLYSLDRIDVNGNYEPGNCRWATAKTQSENRRVKKIEQFSDTDIRKEYSKRFEQNADLIVSMC